MKIIADGRPLLTRRAGIGQYTYHLLYELTRLHERGEFYISGINNFLNRNRILGVQDIKKYDERLMQIVIEVPFPFRKVIRNFMSRYDRLAINKIKPDLYWGTNFLGYFGDFFKTVITIHDMAYQYYPHTIHPVMYKDLSQKLKDHAHRAHAIIAVSESTKRDIVKFLDVPEEKVRVIYNGVNGRFRPIYDKAILELVRQKYRLPDKFILFLGMLEPRKNIVGLIKAYKELTMDPQFKHGLVVVGGKGWYYKEIFKAAEDLGINEQVVFTGYVPDEDLPAFYNLADVFVYPSLYEGFGIPVVEAMACGIPVIASNVASLPEIGGHACIYISPHSVDEMAKAIHKCLSDVALRNSLKEAGLARVKEFTWENSARKTLKLFQDTIDQ